MSLDRSENDLLDLIREIGDNADHLRLLEAQLRTRIGVIPLVGAGLSVPIGFPGWSNFLVAQAEKAGITNEIKARLNAGEYEEAAQDLLDERGAFAFNDAIKNTFGSHRIPKGELKGAVTVIPKIATGPVITTNFDRVLERAFEQSNTSFTERVWGAKTDLATEGLLENRRFLLKIHGDVEDSNERVLTQADYVNQYGSADGSRIDFTLALPKLLQQLLISRPLLFLGCSLKNDRTLAVLEAVAKNYRAIAHYAVVEQPDIVAEFRSRSKFLSNHNIRPIWYPSGRHELVGTLLDHLAGITVDTHEEQTTGSPAQTVRITNRVTFETERKPRDTELLRAVHTIVSSSDPAGFSIPLEYDSRIPLLIKKVEHLYANYETLMKDEGGPAWADELESIQLSRTIARTRLGKLPEILGTVVERLSKSVLKGNNVAIAVACSRVVELTLTHVIFRLSKFQFASDESAVLTQYDGRGGLDEFIARLDGVPLERLISYRILFFGDAHERIFFAPIDYGSSRLLLLREFNAKGRGYMPPVSFITDYAFPQMVWENWNEPDEWTIHWQCERLDAKNLQQEYLTEAMPWEPSSHG